MARRRIPRLPRQRFPDAIAERYAAELVRLVERTWAKFLPGLLAGYEREQRGRNDADGDESSEPPEVLRDVLAGARRTMRREYGSIGIGGRHGEDAADFNRGAIIEQIGRVATVNPLAEEPWLKPVLDAWRGSNVALIRGMDSQADAIEQMVQQAWERGRPVAELRKQLEERLDIDRRRAQLIARDQVGKLNGQLTMVRQSSLGIEKYRWMSSMDERVRQVHADRHGELFEWATPPADGHPGMPVRCRCTAEPDIADALEELERLGGEELTFGRPEVERLEEAVRNLGQWEPDAALRRRWVEEARAGVTAMQDPAAARAEASAARARVRQARAPVNVARQGRPGRSARDRSRGNSTSAQSTATRSTFSTRSNVGEQERGVAPPLARQPISRIVTDAEAQEIGSVFEELGGVRADLRFNYGFQTGFHDASRKFHIRGDIFPHEEPGGIRARSRMSIRAVLAHEIGHSRTFDRPLLPIGHWFDEYRASLWAADNVPNLTGEDRGDLLADALDQYREALSDFGEAEVAKHVSQSDIHELRARIFGG